MKRLKIFLFVVALSSCSSRQQLIPCNLARAKQIAEKQFSRKGFDTKRFVCTVRDSANYFLISYQALNLYMTGGGGDFVIDKNSCKIAKASFYQ